MNVHTFQISLLSLAIAGMAPGQDSEAKDTPTPESPPAPAAQAGPRVALETSHGRIVIELDEQKAPLTVKNFLSYLEDRFYDGTVFHRVIGTFMIQGGGFEIVDEVATQKKTKAPVKNEAKNGLENVRGTIAMARTGAPHSATSQFFINVVDNPNLNPGGVSPDGYAVFGKVVEGMEVVDKIRKLPTGAKKLMALDPLTGNHVPQMTPDVPQEDVVIKTARRVETN